MIEQLLKTSGADVLSSRKKLRKPYGASIHPAPTPLVRPRVKHCLPTCIHDQDQNVLQKLAISGPTTSTVTEEYVKDVSFPHCY